jgi:alpha-mannosidase
MIRRVLVLLLMLTGSLTLRADEKEKPAAKDTAKPVLWILPHTHWEGAVFKSREDYLEMGLPHILTALRLLKQYPAYRFTLDQVAYYRPFLERYPEEATDFRRFVAEGRLQIVGGMDVMPDDNMPSGESFIRQVLYGKGYARKELGIDVKTSWMLDTFGHHAQMPQLLRLARFDSFWYFRGVVDANTAPVQSLWQGLDGSVIRCIKPPFVFYDPPKELNQFSDFMEKRYQSLAPFSQRETNRVDLDGVDVSDPELYVPELVEQFNRQPDAKIELRYGVPSDFERAVAQQPDLPLFKGERNPIYQGTYSTRIELKQRMRETERILTTAEDFDAWAGLFGSHSDAQMIGKAWEPALFNVTHDLASGVMTNYVYDDTVRGYDFSQGLGREILEGKLEDVLHHIDTRGEGTSLAVFNTLGWTRTDVAEGEIGFAAPGVSGFDVLDTSGNIVPSQILELNNYEDGGMRTVKFVFLARNIPPMGYAVYHVVSRTANGTAKHAVTVADDVIESPDYRAVFDTKTGALSSLYMKAGDWDVLRGSSNIIAEEQDNGDFWELNHTLDGSQSSMMMQPVDAPERGKAKFSDEFSGESGSISVGPVFSEFHIEHGFGNNDFATTARIYNGLPRIEFTTQVLNRDQHVRYRVLFPVAVNDGRNFQEIPFGAIERSQNMEFPAQNWIDWGGPLAGVALLNRGLPGNNIASGTLLLSLLRSVRIQAYDSVGGFEGQASDSGLEIGKNFTFHYALLPHVGDWRQAHIYRAGFEFNNPLIVRKAASHAGVLPPMWGIVEVSPANVVMSAFKSSADGDLILRIYEATGQSTKGARIKLHAGILAASETSLLEDAGPALAVQDNSVAFDLHPYEIKTLRLHVAVR